MNNQLDKLQVIDHIIVNACKLRKIEWEMEKSEVMTVKVLDYKGKPYP